MLNRIISVALLVACLALAIALTRSNGSTLPAALPAVRAEAAPGVDPVDEEHRILDRPIGDVRFDQKPLNEVIDTLSDRSKVTLFVRWQELEGAGIDRTAPVTLHLHDASLRQALQLLEEHMGGKVVRLAHVAADGIVTFSTIEDMSKLVTTEIYDLREILDGLMARNASLEKASGAHEMPRTYGDASEFLVKLVTDNVAPETWRINGGTMGDIGGFGGLLFVTESPQNHREIRQLLGKVRDAIRRHEPLPATRPASST